MAKVLKGISKVSQQILESGETDYGEFKETIKALKPEDLVAFANSLSGGVILIGIKDSKGVKGSLKDETVGCKTDDEAIRQIVSKAQECIPPVKVTITVENTKTKPAFLRVDIPSGSHKPYCTKQGEYVIRMDSRVRGLHPDEILAIFLEKEGNKFLGEFRNSISLVQEQMNKKMNQISDRMLDTQGLVHLQTASIENDLTELSKEFRASVTTIEQDLEEASAESNETLSELEGITQNTEILLSEVSAIKNIVYGANVYHQLNTIQNVVDEINSSIENISEGKFEKLAYMLQDIYEEIESIDERLANKGKSF